MDELLAARREVAHELDLARLDDVHEVAGIAFAEQHLARRQRDLRRRPGVRDRACAELDDPVGEGQEAVVVGRDDDDPSGLGQLTEEAQHAVDLDVVEVGGRLVGEDERRVVRESTRDRDPLLLTARQVTRPVVHAVGQADVVEQLDGPGPRFTPRHLRGAAAAPRRSRARSGSG